MAAISPVLVLLLLILAEATCIADSRAEGQRMEIQPDHITISAGNTTTFVCISEFSTTIPLWMINETMYRVSDLPLGYEAKQSDLSFPAYYTTLIRCCFLTLSEGQVCSNVGTVTTASPSNDVATQEPVNTCDPENITFLFLRRQNKYVVNWDINRYHSNCSFSVTFTNCSNPLTEPCTINVDMSRIRDQHAEIPLDHCFGTNFVYPDGAIIDIRWNSPMCSEGDTSCSKEVFIPADVNTTVISKINENGTISNLSNQYCSTDSQEYTQWLLCFRSSSGINGCFNAESLMKTQYFRVVQCDDTSCLKVNGLISDIDGTVISVYCTPEEQCNQSNIDVNIFNFEIRKGDGYWLMYGTCHHY
jgi:hypothetical protein